jgi:acetylornithine deacetylase/succinyl-diaminopimelate desuccinylase-like protein
MHPLLVDADLDRWGEEAVTLLQGLLRFDTTNPPGDEADCAAFLAHHLRAGGLEPEILESAPRRANLLTRLRGDGSGGGPLLLNAHLDVVPAEPDRWSHPPFAAEFAGGYLWGRGAIDMKHMAAMSATVMRMLAASGARLSRDVIFAGVADEEAACTLGSEWLVNHHADKVRAEYALGEVGGFTLHVGGTRVYPVQIAEKGLCWIRARARGQTGHGSIPREDNAVVRLAAFLRKVGRTPLPVHRSRAVERFCSDLAAAQGGLAPRILPLALNDRLSRAVLRLLPDPSARRTFSAILRNTATPTVLRAGGKTNVIPGTAEAEIDGRIAVGSTAEELLAELRGLAGPNIDLEIIKTEPPTATSPDTDLFALIAGVVAEHDRGATVVPAVITGFTDASRWSRLGVTCYGFSPVALDPDVSFADLFHGDDERIPVDGFKAGLRMLADVVARWCTAPVGHGRGGPWARTGVTDPAAGNTAHHEPAGNQ